MFIGMKFLQLFLIVEASVVIIWAHTYFGSWSVFWGFTIANKVAVVNVEA